MPPEVVRILASSTVFVKASNRVNRDFAGILETGSYGLEEGQGDGPEGGRRRKVSKTEVDKDGATRKRKRQEACQPQGSRKRRCRLKIYPKLKALSCDSQATIQF